jgi:hypothetical protein
MRASTRLRRAGSDRTPAAGPETGSAARRASAGASRPSSFRAAAAVPQQHLREPMPCRHPLQTRVLTRPDQIASRLQLRRRNIDRLEQPARTQPRELTRVAAVGLDPIIRPRRQQPRRHHLANDSPPHQIAIQVKAGPAPPRSNNAPPASGATSARPPPSRTQACVRRATHRCGQRRVGSELACTSNPTVTAADSFMVGDLRMWLYRHTPATHDTAQAPANSSAETNTAPRTGRRAPILWTYMRGAMAVELRRWRAWVFCARLVAHPYLGARGAACLIGAAAAHSSPGQAAARCRSEVGARGKRLRAVGVGM